METVQSVCASFRLDVFDRSQGRISSCSDSPRSFRSLRLALSPTKRLHVRALPFSLNTAPLIFTHIVESIASHIRQKHCLHVHVYLNDWLFRHQDREILLKLAPEIVAFLQSVGWEVNLEKSSLTPSQSFEYLGLRFCKYLEIVRPADHLLHKICAFS